MNQKSDYVLLIRNRSLICGPCEFSTHEFNPCKGNVAYLNDYKIGM